MMLRLLLVAVLVGGCSAGTPSLISPGKTARAAIVERFHAVGRSQGYPQGQIDCMGAKIDATLNDAEMQAIDATLAAGKDSQVMFNAIGTALSACTK